MTTTTTPATMRALLQTGYGGVEMLRDGEAPAPAPRAGRVLVRVEAMSPDSGTIHLLTGRPLMVRPFLGLPRPRQPIPGLAFAGRVEALPPGATPEQVGFAVGDRIAGSAPGAFAELVLARPHKLARIPDGVPTTDAAALPISSVTALQAVRDVARVREGQRVLVIGAGGGVGSALVQLAVLAGARVTGVASASKAAFVRSLGAERTIDYRAEPGPDGWGRYDAVIDTADGRTLSVLRRLLTERGALVIVGADHVGGPVLDGFDRSLRAALLGPWVRHRVAMVMQKESGADLAIVLDHVAAGRMSAAVDEVAPVEGARDAIDRLARREVRGKVAIAMSPR
ncbi:NAD(P)-dependent alcohol dehydrogenase [Microcella alkalica]|uniref:NADPH:quinone reductase-like Zn-dependent oxidoreductase n=1 Tax=Microcella alkalica TaxID=355930 RepID=A0A839E8D6_9MICO|nr:NAD(P)-dependent alcohol dehydrogenase [Microcella alkalica]MBA8847453.1 NADPH:quinone reductase-like Zn-dependent oxidoreductase [Microcella alkalica]